MLGQRDSMAARPVSDCTKLKGKLKHNVHEVGMNKISDSPDRRRLQRFPALQLEAGVKVDRGMLGHWRTINAFDFTRSGLSITCETNLVVGATVLLRLTLPLPSGDLKADQLIARVRNVKVDEEGHRRYGVEFDFDANRHMRALATMAGLGRMEGILDRSEKLRYRLMTEEEFLHSIGE